MKITIDYPIHPRARWGYGAASNPYLESVIEAGRARYEGNLEGFLPYAQRLAQIPLDPDPNNPQTPNWNQEWLPGLDSAALYVFLARRNPTLYVEVGSGNSTKFARRSIRDNDLRTRIISFDPAPRAEVDAICDEVIRKPVEDAPLEIFDEMKAGDILFVDNSHRCFQNSDVTVCFLEILPRLAPGVLVEFHDIFLPWDYPPEWTTRYYSEQYLLAGLLLGGAANFRIELPNFYIHQQESLRAIIAPIWDQPSMKNAQRHGGSFWIEVAD